ncbi:MAG: phage terminase large subunit [Planctomycetota bacterium]
MMSRVNRTQRIQTMMAAELSKERQAVAGRSLGAFCKVYLEHHFTQPPSPMHTTLFEELDAATRSRRARLAIAAPRGHAKSTCVSLAYVLYAALCHREPYVLIVSATEDQAGQLLKHVRDELETNILLRTDFPELQRKPRPWRQGKIEIPTGTLARSIGVGQQIRGTRHGPKRPSLIVVDDLESQDQVLSAEQRSKTREWFQKTLLKLGDDKTNVVVVGTILHYDALLADLMDPLKSPGWKALKYRALIREPERHDLWARWEAIYCRRESWECAEGPDAARQFYSKHADEMEAGAEVLWPQVDPLDRLQEMRLTEGRASFDSEKQNEPLDPNQCLFKPSEMAYWCDEHVTEEHLLKHLGENARIVGAWDPSMGADPRRGDYSAIVLIARNMKAKTDYVLAADIARRSPTQSIARILEYAKRYQIHTFMIEENGFQKELSNALQKAAQEDSVHLRVNGVKSTANKRARIELLEPAITQQRLRFCRRHNLLLEQLRQFPLGAHDDGPDALHMAVSAPMQSGPRFTVL